MSGDALADMASAMLDALRPPGSARRSLARWPGGAIAAAAHTPAEDPAEGVQPQGGPRLVLAGACVGLDELAESRGIDRSKLSGSTAAGLVAALISAGGADILHDLNGVFSLFWQDPATGDVFIANDRYGFCPLYYCRRGGLLLVASECKSICAAAGPLTLDAGAFGDFFYVGHMLGNRTLFREIRALGPGEYLHWSAGRLEPRRYWDFSRIAVRPAGEITATETCERLNRAVARRARPGVRHALFLSGGFDSRLILGSLLAGGCRPDIVSVEHGPVRQGLEGRLARQVAEAMGLNCAVRPTRREFFESEGILEVFHVLDGLVPTFDLFLSQLYAEVDASMERVWDGLALDVVLGGHLQFGGGVRANLPFFQAPRAIHRRFLRCIFRDDWFEQVEREFHEGLQAEAASVPDNEDGWMRFLLKNRTRRRIGVNPHQLFARKVQCLTPGTDTEFLDYLLSVPGERRRNHRLYIELFERGYPALTGVPVFSGGNVFSFRTAAGRARHEMREGKHGLRQWVKALGWGPPAKALYRRLRGLGPAQTVGLPPRVVLDVAGRGVGRDLYNRAYLEKALRGLQRGSLYWMTPLMLVFHVEMWRLLLEEGQYEVLRREVFRPGVTQSEPPRPASSSSSGG